MKRILSTLPRRKLVASTRWVLVIAALSASGGSALVAEQLQPLRDVTKPGSSSRPAPIATAPVAPEINPSVLQFDLVCERDGRVLADPFPNEHRSSPMLSNEPFHESRRYIVDLERLEYCEPVECAEIGPAKFVALTAEHMTLYDTPGITWTIRRSDGYSQTRMELGHRVEEIEGFCRRESFSGFPPLNVVAEEPKELKKPKTDEPWDH